MSEMELQVNGEMVTLQGVKQSSSSVQFELNGQNYHFRIITSTTGSQLLQQEVAENMWRNVPFSSWSVGRQALQVALGDKEARVQKPLPGAVAETATGNARAPMPGQIVEVLVAVGAVLKQGDAVAVMEAMKLQTTLIAGRDGVVEAVLVKAGDKVEEGAEIVQLCNAQK